MRKSGEYKKLFLVALLGIAVLLGAAALCYTNVRGTILQNEEKSMKSLAKVSTKSLVSSLEAKKRMVYAALSGDREDEWEVTEGMLKIGERTEWIRTEEQETAEGWKQELCRQACAEPGEVLTGPLRKQDEGYHALYMTKAVSVNGRIAGCVLVELNLDEIYTREQALSYLEEDKERYCIVKQADGTTIMPAVNGKKDISLAQTMGNGCREEWIYEPQDGTVNRIRKLVAYERFEIGGEPCTLFIIEDYDKVTQMIERIALYFSIIGAVLVLWAIGFIYKLTKQQQEEELLLKDLNHEKMLNETMKKQEGLMQKYNHSKTMSVLTGSIAHEFNNLMTPIILYTELLEENPTVRAEMPEEIAELGSAARRCEELAKQLLGYSRQGRAEKVLTDYDATYAVNEAVNVVKKLIPANIRLKMQICRTSYYIHGQVGALNQIMLNLVTNALHAMKEGGTLNIWFGLSTEDDHTVRLIVEDTGSGIPEEIRQKVFQPFFTTKGAGEGSGIGLTVVRRLTEEHGGRIQVKSETGKGTRFVLDFPRVDRE